MSLLIMYSSDVEDSTYLALSAVRRENLSCFAPADATYIQTNVYHIISYHIMYVYIYYIMKVYIRLRDNLNLVYMYVHYIYIYTYR